jgi:hypothetical protein
MPQTGRGDVAAGLDERLHLGSAVVGGEGAQAIRFALAPNIDANDRGRARLSVLELLFRLELRESESATVPTEGGGRAMLSAGYV